MAQAFPSPPAGAKLLFWNGGSQSWNTIYWFSSLNQWSAPSYVITNGAGFYWENTSVNDHFVTVSGDAITNASVTRSFVGGNSYLISDCYLRSLPAETHTLECVLEDRSEPEVDYYHYTYSTLGYTSTVGDVAHVWNRSLSDWEGGVRIASTECSFNPFWHKIVEPPNTCYAAWGSWLSPVILPGRSIWLMPSANVTWTIPSEEIVCE